MILRHLSFSMAALGALYVALSPRVAFNKLYSSQLFHPQSLGSYDSKVLEGVEACEVFVPSTNGSMLHAWHFGLPDASHTVLLHHGNAGNLTNRLGGIRLLLKAGVSVFAYDYQGFGKSSGKPSLMGICEDGLAALAYLTDRMQIKLSQIINYGESLGSAVACAVTSQQKCAGLILQSGFTSLKQISREHLPMLKMYPAWLFPRPALDNLAFLQSDHPPILIMHGMKDKIVPYSHAEQLYAAAAEPKRLVSIKEAGHSDIAVVEPHTFTHAARTFVTSLPPASNNTPTDGLDALRMAT